MAGKLLMLLDDIATILDDVSVMTKVAAKKTAGVLGDDLALNAQQVSGVKADRELPVVWAVAKGSFINKLILVPAALLLSFLAARFGWPWLITIPLMIGGLYLCYEGVEKLAHKFLHRKESAAEHEARIEALVDGQTDMVAFEQDKIKGAIRTDFILSAEIVVIALGTMTDKPFTTQVATLSVIGILMTVGVYGLVAAIVKIDDLGLHLQRKGSMLRSIGSGLLAFAPVLMKFLSFAGTAAMFLVGGGILVHNLPFLHHQMENMHTWTNAYGTIVSGASDMGYNLIVGLIAGALALMATMLISRMRGKPAH